MVPSGITKVEKGTRQVSAEELLLFAAALNASPADFVDGADPDTAEPIIVAPNLPPEKPFVVRAWFAGEWPIPVSADMQEFRQAAPSWFRDKEEQQERTFRHPAMMSLSSLKSFLHTAVLGEDAGDPQALAKAIRQESDRLAAYASLLADETEQKATNGR